MGTTAVKTNRTMPSSRPLLAQLTVKEVLSSMTRLECLSAGGQFNQKIPDTTSGRSECAAEEEDV